MSFLKCDNEISYFNSSSIELVENIPVGIYKISFSPKKGAYLENTEIKLTHGKIYGNSQNVADHIIEAYSKLNGDKNLGVLLSGGRGLGKTLTTRLVIEKAKDRYPIIIVSEYFGGLVEMLNHLSGCVILMDEFEKFMSGNIAGNDDSDEQSKQESILSVFDGNTGSKNNLFLLTVNDVCRLDQNLLSRPGRIRYHYKFESEKEDVITAYCKDNLIRQELIPEILETLMAARYVSMDIITAFVQELNDFDGVTPKEVQKYFNLEQDTEYLFLLTLRIKGEDYVYRTVLADLDDDHIWTGLDTSSRKKADANKEYDIPRSASFEIDASMMPTFVFGNMELPVEIAEIKGFDSDNLYKEDAEIINIQILDKKSKQPKSMLA